MIMMNIVDKKAQIQILMVEGGDKTGKLDGKRFRF